MKPILMLFIAFMLFGLVVKAQNVITVDNNIGSGAMYTNLQAAIDAALPGDIIHISGSATSYGSINLGKQLTIIGAGFHNPYGLNTVVDYVGLRRTNVDLSASGSVLKGIFIQNYVSFHGEFPGGTAETQKLSNISIERCKLYLYFYNSLYANITIKNSWLVAYQYNINGTNIVFANNIFDNCYFEGGINCNSLFIRNNIFLNLTGNVFRETGNNVVVENNIFYGSKPQGMTGATFNNNLTYMCIDNNIPGTGNVGSGNLVNQDPKFMNFPLAGGPFSWTYDFHLKPNSPCIGAGTDGSDIGIYGGDYNVEPFGANPNIPQMIEIVFPENQSTAPVNGTLNVNFKATKRN